MMQILALCSHCHTQYDASDKAPGDAFRCHCGAIVAVPEPREQAALVAHCPDCGAPRTGNSPTCSFCGSRFSSADAGWGLICPHCFCRLPNDAAFCVECGLKLTPQPLGTVETSLQCPRCSSLLQERWLESIHLHECGACGGIWLGTTTFESLCRDREYMVAATSWLNRLHSANSAATVASRLDEPVRYLPCPTCKDFMVRHNFVRVSGVIIDLCRAHGVWLDNDELSRILHFIESGGMDRAHGMEIQDLRDERSLNQIRQ